MLTRPRLKPPYYESRGHHRTLTYRPDHHEFKRVYTFPGGDVIEIENVVKASVSRHGNHQLVTADGAVHVIPWGWICLTFPESAKVTPEEVKAEGE